MKLTILLTVLLTLVLVSAATAAVPMMWDVWAYNLEKSSTWLGTIGAYEGTQSHADNYNYYSASGHPINGPNPQAYNSFFYLYHRTGGGISFNFIHNVDAGGGSYWNHVQTNFFFGNAGYSFALQDDDNGAGHDDNQGEPGLVDNGGGSVSSGFAYTLNTDGGVIRMCGLSCNSYIDIMPVGVGDIQQLWFASSGSPDILGWNSQVPPPVDPPNGEYFQRYPADAPYFRLTPHCVPEPTTLLLLGSGLLVSAGFLRRKR